MSSEVSTPHISPSDLAIVRGAIASSYSWEEHITGESFDRQRVTAYKALDRLIEQLQTAEQKLAMCVDVQRKNQETYWNQTEYERKRNDGLQEQLEPLRRIEDAAREFLTACDEYGCSDAPLDQYATLVEAVAGLPDTRDADERSLREQLETLRQAVMQRISPHHDDYCSWLTKAVCDCGVAESEKRMDEAIRASSPVTESRFRNADYGRHDTEVHVAPEES